MVMVMVMDMVVRDMAITPQHHSATAVLSKGMVSTATSLLVGQ